MNELEELNISGLCITSMFSKYRDKLSDELNSIFEHDLIHGGIINTDNSKRLRGLLRSASVVQLLEETNICSIIESYIGCPIILSGAQMNVVVPGVTPLAFHRDYPYFCDYEMTTTKPLVVQVIMALDEFTTENGCTRYIQNSGKQGPTSGNSEQALLKCGESIIMRGDFFHAVEPNRTDKNCRSLLLNFHPYWVRPMSDYETIAGVNIDTLSSELQCLLGRRFRSNLLADLRKSF
jgi:ectoine hydroxylase-related dioxygenase (phytanoyl-CoA dioxygenase family)